MTTPQEPVIGYDARAHSRSFKQEWTAERINTYLLKDDVVKPLSVDVMVWDDVFTLAGRDRPAWTGPRQTTWDNLDRLQAFLTAAAISGPYWVIAITEYRPEGQPLPYEIHPPVKAADWRFLGFDVADPYLLSGLMNCGYWPEERRQLQQAWQSRLNSYHLFEDISDALAYRALTDERVQEHQPFAVYGLYLVEARGG